MYLFLKKRKHKIPSNNILNDEQPFNDFVKHSEFFMKLTSGPLFRFLSPVIDIYALPALSTSIQFTLCFLHPTPFLASLLSPWVYTFLFLKISLFKIVIFTCSLGGILPLFSLSASQIYSCELRFSALFISQVSINGCACVCLSLFFLVFLCVFNFQFRNKLWVWGNKSEDEILSIRIFTWSSIFFTLCQNFEIINEFILFIISFYLCVRLSGLQLLCFW